MHNLLLSVVALPLLASSLVAQTVPEIEPNDTSATATPLTIGRQAFGAIDLAADNDFYAITLTSAQDVRAMTNPGRINAAGVVTAACGDTILSLIAADGVTVLASNDDFTGRNLYSQVTVGNLAAGTYYLKVIRFGNVVTGAYTLDCYSTPPGDLVPLAALAPVSEGAEPNDPRVASGVATASARFTRNSGNASLGAGATSFVDPTADYDFYAFTVGVGQTGSHTLSTVQTPTLAPAPQCVDTVIFLVDSANTVLASNDDFTGLYSQLTFNIATPGTYYAVVKCYGAGDEGNYVLDIIGPTAIPAVVNATFTALAGGCTGSAGIPNINTLLASSFRPERPMLGTEFVVNISNMPAAGVAIRLLGVPFGAPVDMTGIGAPGCFLEVNPLLISAALADAAGVHAWVIGLPYDLNLRGVTVDLQAVVLDAPANLAGLTFSNRATAVLGNGY